MKKGFFTFMNFAAAALVLGTMVSASDSVLEPSVESLLAEIQPTMSESSADADTQAAAESTASAGTQAAAESTAPADTQAAAESTAPAAAQTETEVPEIIYAEAGAGQYKFGGFVYASWYDGFYRKMNEMHAVNLNQACLYFGRELDTSRYGIDWGYYVEAIFGTEHGQCADSNFDGNWGVSGDGYGMSLNQCYAEVGIANLSLKIGKFASPLGYESTNGIERDFNSTSYMYGLEPANHCGILGTLDVSDRFSLNAGITTGENRSFNGQNNYGFLFGASFSVTDRLTVSYEGMINRVVIDITIPYIWQTFNIMKANQYEHSLIASWDITSRLNYTFVTDYGSFHEMKMDMTIDYFGIGNYLTYQLSDKMKAVARYEWITGMNGILDCSEITLALRYDVNEHLMIRPEIRYDWLDMLGMGSSGLSGGIGAAIIF